MLSGYQDSGVADLHAGGSTTVAWHLGAWMLTDVRRIGEDMYKCHLIVIRRGHGGMMLILSSCKEPAARI